MGRQPVFSLSAGNGRSDHGRAEMVADIILYDQHGPDAALFTSYDWPEIRIIQIPSFNLFQFHATSKHFQRPISKAACCSSLASASTSARATISSSISI